MPLPDERPRASVANLIGRFEKQTKKAPASDDATAEPPAPKPIVANALFVPKSIGKETTAPPSWMKKKDSVAVGPQPPAPATVVSTNGSSGEKGATPPTSDVVAERSMAAEPTDPDPIVVTPDAEVLEPQSVVSPKPVKVAAKPSRPTTGTRVPPTASASALFQSVIRTPSSSKAPAPNRVAAASTSTPLALNKSKSTPHLQRAPAAPSSTPKQQHHPPAPILKPQHTGTSTASNARRIVTTTMTPPSRTKTPSSTPARPKTNGSGSGTSSALYAPTASSLAKSKAAAAAAAAGATSTATSTTKKHPPSSFSTPKPSGSTPPARPRSGSSGSVGLKPLQLSLKSSSMSASGSTRRLVAVPRSTAPPVPAVGKREKSPAPAPKVRNKSPIKSPKRAAPAAAKTASAAVATSSTAMAAEDVFSHPTPPVAVPTAAMTSEEELILLGDISVTDNTQTEEAAMVGYVLSPAPPAQENLSSPAASTHAPLSEDKMVVTAEEALVEPEAATRSPDVEGGAIEEESDPPAEAEDVVVEAHVAPTGEPLVLTPSRSRSLSPPGPETLVESSEVEELAHSNHDEDSGSHVSEPVHDDADQLEHMVSMLEGSSTRILHREDDEEVTHSKTAESVDEEIPDIPDC